MFLAFGLMAGIGVLVYILWVAYEAYSWTRTGVIKVEIFNRVGDSIVFKATVKPNTEDDHVGFKRNGVYYTVVSDNKYMKRSRVASGLVTVFKYYYLEGLTNPIDFSQMKLGEAIVAAEVKDARENHIVAEAFRAWLKSTIPPELIAFILGIVILGSAFGVYKALDGKISHIQNTLELQQLVPQDNPLVSGGSSVDSQ